MMRFALALPLVLMAGCTYKYHTVPEAAPEFAKADYRVLGKTNHEECGTYILAIDFGHLFANQRGTRLSNSPIAGIPFIGGGGSPEEARALYHALDKMPEATHLLAHRTHTTSTGLVFFGTPIFGQRCAAVEARGVKIGEKPAEGTPTL
jgi:hypothetical protein